MQSLTFPADLNNLQAIRKYVKVAAGSAGLDDSASYKLQLAVDEIATNIIIYGYQQADLQGDIVLTAEILPNVLRVVIEDSSAEFDPRSRVVDESDLSTPLEERAIGGLGIFLAIKGVDRFLYERKEGKNYSIFEMDLKKTSTS